LFEQPPTQSLKASRRVANRFPEQPLRFLGKAKIQAKRPRRVARITPWLIGWKRRNREFLFTVNPQGRTARDEYLEGRAGFKVSATTVAAVTPVRNYPTQARRARVPQLIADQLWNTAVSHLLDIEGVCERGRHQSRIGDRGQTNELNAARETLRPSRQPQRPKGVFFPRLRDR